MLEITEPFQHQAGQKHQGSVLTEHLRVKFISFGEQLGDDDGFRFVTVLDDIQQKVLVAHEQYREKNQQQSRQNEFQAGFLF